MRNGKRNMIFPYEQEAIEKLKAKFPKLSLSILLRVFRECEDILCKNCIFRRL